MNQRLFRSRTDRVIAGVCGGLGQYLGIDPVLVRVFFVLFSLAGGAGPVVYLVLWLVIPNEEQYGLPSSESELGVRAGQMRDEFVDFARRPNPQAIKYFGAGLLVIGLVLFIEALHLPWLRWLDTDLLWPLLLVLGGGVLLYRALRGGNVS